MTSHRDRTVWTWRCVTQWEFARRTTTEGAAWNLSFVFPLKPIQIP